MMNDTTTEAADPSAAGLNSVASSSASAARLADDHDVVVAPSSDREVLSEEAFNAEWQSVQVAFVDAPRQAVQDANELVATITDRLIQQFQQQRAELERTWVSNQDVSTEDLRIALKNYRALFERLLAA